MILFLMILGAVILLYLHINELEKRYDDNFEEIDDALNNYKNGFTYCDNQFRKTDEFYKSVIDALSEANKEFERLDLEIKNLEERINK